MKKFVEIMNKFEFGRKNNQDKSELKLPNGLNPKNSG